MLYVYTIHTFIYLFVIVKESVNKRPLELGRQGAVRKRKGKIFERNGHKFIQKVFYRIMKCAYCEELFVNEGFQCDGIYLFKFKIIYININKMFK